MIFFFEKEKRKRNIFIFFFERLFFVSSVGESRSLARSWKL